MKWLLCLVLVALAGCSTPMQPANLKLVENQNFSAREGTSSVLVRWVRVPFERLQNICEAATDMPEAAGTFLACAGKEPSGVCVIYTSTHTTHQIFGHELRHCFQGNFHK